MPKSRKTRGKQTKKTQHRQPRSVGKNQKSAERLTQLKSTLKKLAVFISAIAAFIAAIYGISIGIRQCSTKTPREQKIEDACSSARDLQIGLKEKSVEKKESDLAEAVRKVDWADETLRNWELDAYDNYVALVNAKKNHQNTDGPLANFIRAIFAIDDRCRALGVDLSPGPDARACAYTSAYFADARLVTSDFSRWSSVSNNPRLAATEGMYRNKIHEAKSLRVRAYLTRVIIALRQSSKENGGLPFLQAIVIADKQCHKYGGVGMPVG
jgi:hypothetical protein